GRPSSRNVRARSAARHKVGSFPRLADGRPRRSRIGRHHYRYRFRFVGVTVLVRPRLSRSQMLAAGGSALALWPTILRAQTLDKVRLAGVATDELPPRYYPVKAG